uniref:Uncharacterized protein n=1 Tax=Pipistrellus kuhlii TaxID=59472 RepID=A0A7J7QZQ6_PIPKU|nr:hypothetical protein mPipKuh1_008116 [Pipistrellus kuhlii]
MSLPVLWGGGSGTGPCRGPASRSSPSASAPVSSSAAPHRSGLLSPRLKPTRQIAPWSWATKTQAPFPVSGKHWKEVWPMVCPGTPAPDTGLSRIRPGRAGGRGEVRCDEHSTARAMGSSE